MIPASTALPKGNILIVDDVPDNLTFLHKMLSSQGYKVRSALTGRLAIQSVLTKPPDLILLDILMPDMDGYEVCQQLKAGEETCHIPIIFVSALSETIDKVKAFSIGGNDYLTKPLQVQEAIARIEHQLNLKRLQQQLIDRNQQLEQEIGARQQAEEALQLAMREVTDIKFALDQSAIVAITDAQGRITYANDQFCAISKYSRQELLGQTHSIVNSSYHPQEFFQQMWQVISMGQVWKGEIRNRAKDGTFYWVDTVIVPLLGTDGTPHQYVSIRHDISDRNRATLDKIRATLATWHLTKAEEQVRLLQSVVVNANDAVVITEAQPLDMPGPRIIYVNEAFTRMTGYQLEDVVGKTPRILQGEKTNAVTRAQIRAALESWQPVRAELLNYRKDGTEFWVDLNITPLTDDIGWVTHWIAVQRDICERKEAELSLQRQAQIIDQVHDSVIVADLKENIISWNKGAEKRFGYQPQQILGQPLAQLCASEEHGFVQEQIFRPLLEKGEHEIEVQMLTKAQEGFPAHLSLSVLKDNEGKVVGLVSYCIDISDRKRAEAEILNTLEKERELNDLKTRFVSMVSHEYRTPLATILSSLELLEYYGHRSTESEKQENYQQIRLAIQRMTDLLNDVLTLNKSEAGKLTFNPAPLDLGQFCQDLVNELQRNIKTEHQIFLSVQDQCPQAQMDEKLLRHILSNLISNAVKYSPQRGTINFEVRYRDHRAIFYVQDQGIGIPTEALQNLFQPFYRANNVGNIAGTGLGLSIVKRLVDTHGGSINVESQVGSGTTFIVTLPLTAEDGPVLPENNQTE